MRLTPLAGGLLVAALLLPQPAEPTTYLVNPDGSGDFPTIQDAVDTVVNGDVIELGSGVFTGPGNHDVTFLAKAITIRSQTGNPLACVIDAQGSASHEARGFVFDQFETPLSRLEGVTVMNGYLPPG